MEKIEEKEPAAPAPNQPQQVVPTLIIRMRGPQIEVEGPIENKILCYGMLKLAEQAVEGYRPDPGIIQMPTNPPLRGRFGPIS